MPKKREYEAPFDKATRMISGLDEAIQKRYLEALADSLRFDPDYVPPAAQPPSPDAVNGEASDGEASDGESPDEEASEAAAEAPAEEAGEEAAEETAAGAVAEEMPEETLEEIAEPPKVMSPQEISEAHGIALDDLDAYGIVLRRRDIKPFVSRYGRKLRASDVTLFFKTDSYESYFGKPISRCDNQTKRSATVYGYAEVLQRMGVIEQVKPPQELRELFVKNNVDIP